MSDAAHTNRLAQETSPYLLQHQHNPVDWYAWGEEAFERARREDKPIFLSVGYSTCYWCHVMERQCFEVEAIAAIMNEHFVCVKVDREERPDVDQLYMTAVQVMTRQGGWPMSVWLTPALKPFYAGTYFPPTDSHGRPGFPTLLEALADAWATRRDEVESTADEMVRVVSAIASAPDRPAPLGPETIDRLVLRSTQDFDPEHGGFGTAPKFPRQTLLRLLLTWLETGGGNDSDRARVSQMLTRTLDAMADGGIRDHLGGGFHRYSTDARWLVPHFEIMLYDQAMLAPIYAQAARMFDRPRYARVARGICDFVLREMTGPRGEFFTAMDAEVDGREGLNYLWTPEQIHSVLGAEDGARFQAVYGFAAGPNFADPHHGDGTPDANILHLPDGPGTDEDDPAVASMRDKLRDARATRKQPLLDTKVITAWNAQMISTLATCARELDEDRYRDAAIRCAGFLLREHRASDGTLVRTSRDGKTRHDGSLDDYAFLVYALLELQAATRDVRWRREADALADVMLDQFGVGEASSGGLAFTPRGATDLFVRQKVSSDSPLPAGSAIAAVALHELGRTDRARQIVGGVGKQLVDYAESMSAMLHAAMLLANPAYDRRVDGIAPSASSRGADVVQLSAERVGERQVRARVTISPGYHLFDTDVNPQLGLHATRLRVGGARADDVEFIDYSPGKPLNLPFGPSISGYEHAVEISVTFQTPLAASDRVELSLSFQACDDRACLRPSIVEAIA